MILSMDFDLRVDSFTLWAMDRVTEWRNGSDLSTIEVIGRRFTAELAYAALFVAGIVESVVRFMFMIPTVMIYPFVSNEMKTRLSAIITILFVGNGLLSMTASISAFSMLFLNPCKSSLDEQDLYLCFYPCMN